jgi:hypothetical protein
MGSSPEPAVPAYSRLTMLRKRPQVLGVDLNRSESNLQMRAGMVYSRWPPASAEKNTVLKSGHIDIVNPQL